MKTIKINNSKEASKYNKECWKRTNANKTGSTYMPVKKEFISFFKHNNIEINVDEIQSCTMVSQLLEAEIITKTEKYTLIF